MNSSAGLTALVPPGPVTVTSTVPPINWELPAGDVTVSDVAETTLTPVPALVPNATVSPDAKPVPVIVTAVPPAAGPLAGVTPLTVGAGAGAAYVNWSAELVALVPPGPVTLTSTVPDPAGDVTVIDVAETTLTPVPALPPNATVSPDAKPVPVIVTAVPPAAGPVAGESPLTAGAGGSEPPHVTITGAEFAWMFTPPELSISATYRCVTAADCDTTALKLEPEPECDTITPVEASTIDIPYGVGPMSLFAVAVSVTLPPIAGAVVLAASEIEYVLLLTW